jgi:phosphatidylserine/phosphatidylglycerophosphate/cardiolipin synthase-like enzyme
VGNNPNQALIVIRDFEELRENHPARSQYVTQLAAKLGEDWTLTSTKLSVTAEWTGSGPRPPQSALTAAVETSLEAWKVDQLVAMLHEHQPAFDHLAQLLTEPLKAGHFDALVSDDRMGRIPTLFVTRLARRWAHEHNQPSPQVLYVAGGKPGGESLTAAGEKLRAATTEAGWNNRKAHQLDQRLAHDAFKSVRHALIITEYVSLGESLKRVVEAMKRKGIETSVATLEASVGVDVVRRMIYDQTAPDAQPQVYLGAQLHNEEDLDGSRINRQATGIVRLTANNVTARNANANRTLVQTLRTTLQTMADSAYERYF